MKRSIISVSLLLLTFNAYAQTGAGNLPSMNPAMNTDPITNPSGTRFGNTSGVNIPQILPSTIPSNSAIPPTVGPEQQQERTNFAGGSLGGQPSTLQLQQIQKHHRRLLRSRN